MPSYIPESRYDCDSGALKPWPAHLTPQPSASKAEVPDLMLPHVLNVGDVFFLTLDRRDRVSIATTIELLIGALDAMDDDCDAEDGEDAEPSLGWTPAMGAPHFLDDIQHHGEIDLEDACEDEGACVQSQPHDDSQLSGPDSEPSSGWTEAIDQTRNSSNVGTMYAEMEPILGFSGIGTGYREGEGTDDREGDDEREIEYDYWAECPDDYPMFYAGSGGKPIADALLARVGAA